jgi:hypothetical protein
MFPSEKMIFAKQEEAEEDEVSGYTKKIPQIKNLL